MDSHLLLCFYEVDIIDVTWLISRGFNTSRYGFSDIHDDREETEFPPTPPPPIEGKLRWGFWHCYRLWFQIVYIGQTSVEGLLAFVFIIGRGKYSPYPALSCSYAPHYIHNTGEGSWDGKKQERSVPWWKTKCSINLPHFEDKLSLLHFGDWYFQWEWKFEILKIFNTPDSNNWGQN